MVNTFCPEVGWLLEFDNDVGLCFVIANVSLVLHYSPELDGRHRIGCTRCARCFFWIYQTMDGMDGKQA